MSASDIKQCERTDVHQGHHWYEPRKLPPLAAWGLDDPYGIDETPRPILRYCRGAPAFEAFRITVTIEPEPGTRGPFGNEAYTVRKVLDAQPVLADVDAVADSEQTVLSVAARAVAQEVVWRYHEQMLKERAESEGRPYLDEGARARQRYEAELARLHGKPAVRPQTEADAQAWRRVREIVSEADRRMLQPPVYDPSTDRPEFYGWTQGLTLRQCAYCHRQIVRIEPAPGYSEWTTNLQSTAGQECPEGPNRFHAPLAQPVEGTQDTAY